MAIGGTIIMPDPQRESDPEHWLDLLEKEKVTVWNTAPPVMSMLLEWVNSSSVATARFERLSLRVVMLSGDFCPLWVPTKLKELLPIENNLEVSSNIIISKQALQQQKHSHPIGLPSPSLLYPTGVHSWRSD